MIRYALLATMVALIIPAGASAARPTITLAGAEHAARVDIHSYADEYNAGELADRAEQAASYAEAVAAGEDPSDYVPDGAEPLITRAGLDEDSCDIETRYRAVCDAAVDYADGTSDEWTFDVIITRKGHYSVGF